MDPSIPLPNGRNMLEEMPAELLIHIFGYTILVEIKSFKAKPVITSKPLTHIARFANKPSGAGTSISSMGSLVWQSPNAAACYLKAHQNFLLNDAADIQVNVLDLHFTNFSTFLKSLEEKPDTLKLFSTTDKTCCIQFSHQLTRRLKVDPPTFNQYCKRTKKLGITLYSEQKVYRVEDMAILDEFLAARRGVELDSQAPEESQFEQIFMFLKRWAYRESVNSKANRPKDPRYRAALAESIKTESSNYHNTAEGMARCVSK